MKEYSSTGQTPLSLLAGSGRHRKTQAKVGIGASFRQAKTLEST